jgi:co-chaperonin GroES (HSP10)
MAEALASAVEVEINPTETPRKAHLLPDPKGYKILIAMPEPDEKTEGGIIKSQQALEIEEVGSVVGLVVKLGPDAYKDTKRFNVPYCKEGDFILMRAYSGTRFLVHGKEFRIINDDSVEAVVEDPRGIVKI